MSDVLHPMFVSVFWYEWVVVCSYTMLWDKEFQSPQILAQ